MSSVKKTVKAMYKDERDWEESKAKDRLKNQELLQNQIRDNQARRASEFIAERSSD